MSERPVDHSRRKFISRSLTGLAAAGLAGTVPGAVMAQQTAETTDAPRKIIYRELGKTKMKLPIVSMGAMNAGNPEVVAASYKLGVRHFDTAAYYQFGRNEQMLGNVIKKLGVRDKVNIATKVLAGAHREKLSGDEAREGFLTALDGSLKRLQMDYVDIIYLHNVSSAEDISNAGIMEGMTQAKKDGRIRAIGVSTHTNMAGVLNECARTGFYDVVLTSINVSMADEGDLLLAIENAASKGVGIVAMKTQAGGSRFSADQLEKYSSPTVATASLKWVMRNENITTSIPGYDNFQHMNEDFSVAYDLAYTPDEEKLLNDSEIKLGMGFCRQCRSCLASCPHEADIPTLMRVHMYAAGYANFHHARSVLDDIPADENLNQCGQCTNCTAACAHMVDIPRSIDELKTIYA